MIQTLSLSLILVSLTLHDQVQSRSTMNNDIEIAESDPHAFMWDSWNHHDNLNLDMPKSGTCKSELSSDKCIAYKSCKWHKEKATCYLAGNPDEIQSIGIYNSIINERKEEDPNNLQQYLSSEQYLRVRRENSMTYPTNGCDSVRLANACRQYTGCNWVDGTGCFTIVTKTPTIATPTAPTKSPVSTPTKSGTTTPPTISDNSCVFPDNGCSTLIGPDACNVFGGCNWNAKKKKCMNQSGCAKPPPPNKTLQPTVPKQDRIKVDDMCKIPSGGCSSVQAKDCDKYIGCYVSAGVCITRTCDKFDCAIRQLAFDMAVKLLPRCKGTISPNLGMDDCISELSDIHDGLELNARCGFKFNEGIHHSQGGSIVPNLPSKRYYVSTTGDDVKGNGSLKKPYKTIQKAIEVARSSSSIDRAIILRAGTYYVTNTIVLTPQDSKLTIAPYDNEKVILSGAMPLDGIEWKHYNTRILVADVSKYADKLGHLSQVFFNDKPATRARHPNADPWTQGLFTKSNTGYFDAADSWGPSASTGQASVVTQTNLRPLSSRYGKFSLGYGGSCSIFTPPASYWAVPNPVAGGGCTFELPRSVTMKPAHLTGFQLPFQRPTDAYVHAYHIYHWGNWVFRVGSQNGRTFNFQSGGFQEARGSCGDGGSQFYIENMLELLDAKNEFYLDTLTKKLYYFPNATTSDPNNIPTAVATVNRRIFQIAGDSSNPVKNVNIIGLRFEKTYATWMDPHEVPSAGDWSVTRNAAIFIEGGENIVVNGNSFYYMGGNGVFVSNYARNVKITANRFKYLAASAVLVVGDHRYNTPKPWEMLDPNHPFDTIVDGNIASEIGNVVKQSAGFFQALARGSVVQNNVIFNSERTAVNFNDGYGGDNKVYSNLMFNTVRSTIDHGPYNSWDRQAYIQSHPGSNFQPTGEPMMSFIKGNYLLGGYGGIKGIDHDDGSTMWEDSENLLLYTYQKLKGRDQNSHHNLVMFPVQSATYVSEPTGTSSSRLLWHDNRVVIGNKAEAYSFGSEDNCLRQNFQADSNEVNIQGQFWARCTPSTPRTWDEWKSERNQDTKSVVKTSLPSTLTMVRWGYDRLGLDSTVIN